MKALLIKDFLNIKAQGKAILLVLAVWFIISVINGSGSFFAALSVVYAILLPLTSVTADDKCGFERYAMTMPVKRSQLVTVKYLLLCLIVPLAIAAIMAVGAVFHTSLIESVIIALACGAISLFSMSFSLMCCFWLGTEKARILTVVSYMLPMFLVYGVYFLFQRGEIALADVTAEQLAAAAVLCLVAAAVFAILFWRISCRIINKRDL